MKGYTFCLTEKEIREFCLRTLWEQMRLRPVIWILLLAIFVLELLIVPWVGMMVFVLLLLLAAAVIWRNDAALKKALSGKTRTMWISDGMLKVEAEVLGEVPCSSIQVIRRTKHLLLLGHYQGKRRLAWHPVPLRVFENAGELALFLERLRQESAEPLKVRPLGEEAEREGLCLCFEVDERKWLQLLAGAEEIISGKTLGKSRPRRIFFAVYGIALAAIGLGCLLTAGNRILTALFYILALTFLALLKTQYANPKRRILKQIRSGILQNDVYGDWKVTVSENGVTQYDPGKGKCVLAWDSLMALVETELAFYFFQNDKRHFIMIPRACMDEEGKKAELLALCSREQIPVLPVKERRYVPGWIFYVLMAAVVIGYVCSAWLIF